jgi:ribosomal protein S12 methylthiotransferase accessory factor YcaO
MHSGGKGREAIELLEKTAAAHPGDRSLREALISFHAGAGDTASAARHQAALEGLEAADP